jgi:hypothetical protein
MRASRAAAAALCSILAAPAVAAAQSPEVWHSADGESALELRGFFKTLGSGLRAQPELVEITEGLQALIGQAAIEHPDVPLPQVSSVPLYGASSANTARAWGRLLLKNRVEISAAWQVDASVASDRSLIENGGLGTTLPVAGSQAASRRFVDFGHVIASGEHYQVQSNFDLMAVKVTLPKGEIVVGRQVLSWGTGHLWNPTDLLSPFAPTDIDREVRHGVDAVRYSVPLGKTSLLDLLYLPQKEGWAQGGVARVQANARGFDVSASLAKYVSDVVVGADTAGDIGPLAVHAEAAYTMGLENLGTEESVTVGERFVRAVAGVDWHPAAKWIVGAEYYFNGFGAENPAGYAAKLRSDRVVRGEVFGAGRHYAGLTVNWKATDLLTMQSIVLANLADPSALAIPVAEYWAKQNMILRVGGSIPIGARPSAAVLGGLTASDLVFGSPAYVAAVSSLGLRSEYGAAPWGLFAQLGIYF